jgi:probable addiction module antidote protein
VKKKTTKTIPYKTSDYLKTKSDVIGYLNAVLEEDEPMMLLSALRDAALSKGGMRMLAKKAGMNRESLYRSLSPRGNPRFETILKIFDALGLQLVVEESLPSLGLKHARPVCAPLLRHLLAVHTHGNRR